jgi:hypothetical protein
MSNLTFVEKRKFEQLLGMKTGYVLDFSDRSFAEIVSDSTGLDIFDERYKYASGSKANRLRAFWQKEDNAVVGKLMGAILDYSEATGPLAEICRLIVARLLKDGSPITPEQTESQDKQQAALDQQRSQVLRQLKDEFLQLAGQSDRNAAGLELEKLLNRLFELFGLKPRQPFRVAGEQIDGSFEMDAEIYLLESKWEKHPLPEADLLVFREKIIGKSTFTRGVFILRQASSRQWRRGQRAFWLLKEGAVGFLGRCCRRNWVRFGDDLLARLRDWQEAGSTNGLNAGRGYCTGPSSWIAGGTPRPSHIRWRLLPSLARSVGFGPVWRPQNLPGPNCRPRRPATSRSAAPS